MGAKRLGFSEFRVIKVYIVSVSFLWCMHTNVMYSKNHFPNISHLVVVSQR